MKTLDELLEWFSPKPPAALSPADSWLYYISYHPSTRFVKSLNTNARVLDFGAGTGGLVGMKQWPPPERHDLKFFAYSLKYTPNFDKYDGFEIGNFELCPPEFRGVELSALFASHVIEHLADPVGFLGWAVDRTTNDARFYIEWPSEYSKFLPTRGEFLDRGIDLQITNFFDDSSHIHIPARQAIIDALMALGLTIESQGYIRAPFFEVELLASAASWPTEVEREVAFRSAFWSYTKWAQYVIAAKGD